MAKSSCSALIVLMTLAACGGGDGGDTFDNQVEALTTRYSMASAPDPGELSGEATMSGIVGFAIASPTELNGMIGSMEVVANFDSGMMDGTASEFRDAEDMDALYEGELALEAMITDDTFSGGSLIGVVTGTTSDGGVDSTFNANIVLGVDGQFRTDGDGFLAYAELLGETDLEIETGGAPSIYNDLVTDGLFLVGE